MTLCAPTIARCTLLLPMLAVWLGSSPAHAKQTNYAAALQSIYSDYMVVRTCQDMYYLGPETLETARGAVRAKQDYLSAQQAMDVEAIWAAANEATGGMLQLFRMNSTGYNESVGNVCSDAYARLIWPSNGYEPGAVEKDF